MKEQANYYQSDDDARDMRNQFEKHNDGLNFTRHATSNCDHPDYASISTEVAWHGWRNCWRYRNKQLLSILEQQYEATQICIQQCKEITDGLNEAKRLMDTMVVTED